MSSHYYMYAVAYKKEGPVKIGISSNPDKRLKQLQTGSPEKLVLLVLRDFKEKRIAKFAESQIHTLLKYDGHISPSGNEWFSINTTWAQSILTEFPYHDGITDDDGYAVEPYTNNNFIADLEYDDEYSDICRHIVSIYEEHYEYSDEEPSDPLGMENYLYWDDVFPIIQRNYFD